MAGKKQVTIWLLALQAVIVVLFAVFVRYDKTADSRRVKDADGEKRDGDELRRYYPMFQDVHVMIFIGFGFLMTFLKRYGYGSISFNLLLSAIVLQWATLMVGFFDMHNSKIYVNIQSMIKSDFAAAVILISFGAVLGKLSCLQLVVMAVVEVALYALNDHIGEKLFKAADLGGSMFVHTFGAYFGIALARVLYTEDVEKASSKEGAVYHSDLFSMIGTLFLWVYWPSFTSALAPGDDQERAVLNTYFALASCTLVTVAISALVGKDDKLDMVHMQNATLAGGVAIGTTVNMMIHPVGAIAIGGLAGALSVFGFAFLTPFMSSKLSLHDTCGVNNLHGMPGVFAGVAGIVVSAIAKEDDYGVSLYEIFPGRAPRSNTTELAELQAFLPVISAGDGRSAGEQAAYQAAALVTTLAIAVVGGIATGFLIRTTQLEQPKGTQVFDDGDYWEMPDEGVPTADQEMNHLVDPNT